MKEPHSESLVSTARSKPTAFQAVSFKPFGLRSRGRQRAVERGAYGRLPTEPRSPPGSTAPSRARFRFGWDRRFSDFQSLRNLPAFSR